MEGRGGGGGGYVNGNNSSYDDDAFVHDALRRAHASGMSNQQLAATLQTIMLAQSRRSTSVASSGGGGVSSFLAGDLEPAEFSAASSHAEVPMVRRQGIGKSSSAAYSGGGGDRRAEGGGGGMVHSSSGWTATTPSGAKRTATPTEAATTSSSARKSFNNTPRFNAKEQLSVFFKLGGSGRRSAGGDDAWESFGEEGADEGGRGGGSAGTIPTTTTTTLPEAEHSSPSFEADFSSNLRPPFAQMEEAVVSARQEGWTSFGDPGAGLGPGDGGGGGVSSPAEDKNYREEEIEERNLEAELFGLDKTLLSQMPADMRLQLKERAAAIITARSEAMRVHSSDTSTTTTTTASQLVAMKSETMTKMPMRREASERATSAAAEQEERTSEAQLYASDSPPGLGAVPDLIPSSDQFYRRAMEWKSRNDEILKKERKAKEGLETVGCTFKPKINANVPSNGVKRSGRISLSTSNSFDNEEGKPIIVEESSDPSVRKGHQLYEDGLAMHERQEKNRQAKKAEEVAKIAARAIENVSLTRNSPRMKRAKARYMNGGEGPPHSQLGWHGSSSTGGPPLNNNNYTFQPRTNLATHSPEMIRMKATRYQRVDSMGYPLPYNELDLDDDELEFGGGLRRRPRSASHSSVVRKMSFTNEMSQMTGKRIASLASKVGSAMTSSFIERQEAHLERSKANLGEVERAMYETGGFTPTKRSNALVKDKGSFMQRLASSQLTPEEAAARQSHIDRDMYKECTFAPVITEMGHRHPSKSFNDLTRKYGARTVDRLSQLAAEQEAKEASQLTFRPKLSSYQYEGEAQVSSRIKNLMMDDDNSSTSSSSYVDRIREMARQREVLAAKVIRERQNKELEECTFVPTVTQPPAMIARMNANMKASRAGIHADRPRTARTRLKPEWR